ncbi:hypothetical protein BDV95DRAFT_24135 [Massariosphaeria phaeospora]|uniref:Uncharacterized protein n=1 Tax=Massariosphaeria phaeospora TaxID=100035 RepID=A0A7C8MW83_9PLEO|nr:hypothetical protein BDV95DRAFT_24135 [Massariosphaeria phaeospora]
MASALECDVGEKIYSLRPLRHFKQRRQHTLYSRVLPRRPYSATPRLIVIHLLIPHTAIPLQHLQRPITILPAIYGGEDVCWFRLLVHEFIVEARTSGEMAGCCAGTTRRGGIAACPAVASQHIRIRVVHGAGILRDGRVLVGPLMYGGTWTFMWSEFMQRGLRRVVLESRIYREEVWKGVG